MASPHIDIAGATVETGLSRRLANRAGSPYVFWPVFWVLLFAVVYAGASAWRSFTEDHPERLAKCATVGLALLDPKWKNIAETAALAAGVLLVFCIGRAPSRRVRTAERAIARFAAHKTQAILFVALLPMVLRLALLPVLRIPQPLIADEFGYLLIADTFASGRLSNPTHPLWKHFETIYVLHQPTYSSIYPVAPALLLTVPKLIGISPWFGVWFGAGLMCGLICWMLQGWVPPKWALAGGFLAACRFAIIGPWMNTYWGGAAAAIGGALVLGALPRIMRRPRIRDSLLFGTGLAVLAQSRPYEGLLLSAPLTLALLVWLLRARGLPAAVRIRRVALPLAAIAALLAAATGYYNWRVTGSPLLMPYSLHKEIYGTPQSFYWQAPILDAPGIRRHKDIADVFRWQLDAYNSQFSWVSEGERLKSFWHFYLQPLLTAPLLFLPLLLKNRRLRVLFIAAGVMLVGNGLYPFFFPHYAAPLCPLLVLLVVEGMRRLRTLRLRSMPAGAAACHTLIGFVVLSSAVTATGALLRPWDISAAVTPRSQAIEQLSEREGKHLVLVHYSPDHSFHYGVVYNGADIDASDIIWARELDPASNLELVKRYPDRDAWIFNPDEEPVTLIPYSGKPYISVVAAGAGKRDDVRDGVSPGAVAVVLGGNFAREIHGTTNPRSVLGDVPVRLAGATAGEGNIFEPLRAAPEPPEAATPGEALSVRFGDTAAPVLSVSNARGQQSVTIQVPFEVTPGPAVVTLRYGETVARTKVRILPAAPGIFQMRMSDARLRAVLTRADGSVVDLEHPARRGEVLRLFATGLGPLVPPVSTDLPGASPPVSEPHYGILVGVNHKGARLLYARYAPSLVGVEEVAFEVPTDAPSGRDVPLAIAAVVDGKPVYGNKSSLPVE